MLDENQVLKRKKKLTFLKYTKNKNIVFISKNVVLDNTNYKLIQAQNCCIKDHNFNINDVTFQNKMSYLMTGLNALIVTLYNRIRSNKSFKLHTQSFTSILFN